MGAASRPAVPARARGGRRSGAQSSAAAAHATPVLTALAELEAEAGAGAPTYSYFFHADDDSLLRLDLLVPLLVRAPRPHKLPMIACPFDRPKRARDVLRGRARAAAAAPHHRRAPNPCAQEAAPRARFYWGYIWDGTGNRVTAPIRDAANKSHMPVEQVGGPGVDAPECSACAHATPSQHETAHKSPLHH